MLPGALAVFLDAPGSVPRAAAGQQARAGAAQEALLAAIGTALAADGAAARRTAACTARLATPLAHHREARAQSRAGLALPMQQPADLDFAERNSSCWQARWRVERPMRRIPHAPVHISVDSWPGVSANPPRFTRFCPGSSVGRAGD